MTPQEQELNRVTQELDIAKKALKAIADTSRGPRGAWEHGGCISKAKDALAKMAAIQNKPIV